MKKYLRLAVDSVEVQVIKTRLPFPPLLVFLTNNTIASEFFGPVDLRQLVEKMKLAQYMIVHNSQRFRFNYKDE